MDALTLLSGDARTFHTEVWASRVHLHRTEPARLVSLLSLDDVDDLLTGTAIRTPAVRVVADGIVRPARDYTRTATTAGVPLTGLVDARKVLDLFEAGATVVLQGLQRFWPPLSDVVRDLELALGHPCQANAYLTPAGAQGFATHQDTHDVFVFQTHGTKSWTVGPPGAEQEVLLEPGLCLYLPTGTPHSARTQTDTSLHVTVGVNRLTWRDLLRSLTDEALADSRYDEPLPSGYLADPVRLAHPLAAELAGLAKSIDALEAGRVARERSDSFLTHRVPFLRGALHDRVMLARLGDDSRLERRPRSVCELRPDGDRLRVLLGDRELRVPAWLRAALDVVRDRESFVVRELPLDPQSRLVLSRRLVREGLLRIAR